jgi:Tfp pilus assembly protein PilF/ADP-heptose:LPS heptosyltransferase
MTGPGEIHALRAEVDRCIAAGRPEDAEPALRAIVQFNPREHYAWALLGRITLARADPDGALPLIARAVEAARNHADYLNLLGVAHAERGAFDEALGALRKAVRARPAYAEAHFNVGKVLEKQGDMRAALDAFRRAAALDPRYPGARYMHARALFRLGEYDAAEPVLAAALADDPADEWSVVLLGRVHAARHGHGTSIDLYRDAARRLPASGMVARQLAHALLAAGEFRAGWEAYVRRDCAGPAPRRELPARLPIGLTGRTLVLRPEQGLGDILFFLRFAPAAAARGARLVVVAPPRLVPLIERAPLVASVVSEGDSTLPGDATALAVADLPFALGAQDTPPPLALSALPQRVAAWRERLAAFGPAPYVGVAWRAGTDFRRRSEFGANIRSLFKEVPPDRFASVLARAPGTLVSLQRLPDEGEVTRFGAGAGRPVFDAAGANEDLDDALALLAVLDDYVGVSNTNVHLAAGLGRPGRVVVPYPPEWRWMLEGEVSPWFPGLTVYRENLRRSFDEAFAALAAGLRR